MSVLSYGNQLFLQNGSGNVLERAFRIYALLMDVLFNVHHNIYWTLNATAVSTRTKINHWLQGL